MDALLEEIDFFLLRCKPVLKYASSYAKDIALGVQVLIDGAWAHHKNNETHMRQNFILSNWLTRYDYLWYLIV